MRFVKLTRATLRMAISLILDDNSLQNITEAHSSSDVPKSKCSHVQALLRQRNTWIENESQDQPNLVLPSSTFLSWILHFSEIADLQINYF